MLMANTLGKFRKMHIPHCERVSGKILFPTRNLGYPVFDTAVGENWRYISVMTDISPKGQDAWG